MASTATVAYAEEVADEAVADKMLALVPPSNAAH